eukprot:4473177-Alexandrium_andersonii.AAC.1
MHQRSPTGKMYRLPSDALAPTLKACRQTLSLQLKWPGDQPSSNWRTRLKPYPMQLECDLLD